MKNLLKSHLLIITLLVYNFQLLALEPTKKIGATIYINEVCKFNSNLTLKTIEFQEEKTIVELEYYNTGLFDQEYAYVYINTKDSAKTYYVEDLQTREKHFVYKTNLGLTPDAPTNIYLGQVIRIKMELPSLPLSIDEFTLAEGMEGGNWGFYKLKLSDYPTKRSKPTDFYKKEALKMLLEKKYKKASGMIDKYIAKFPKDANGYNIAGVIQYYSHNSGLATDHLEKAIELDQRNAMFHENMYYLAYAIYGKESALEYIDKAIEYNPTYPPYYITRAYLLFDLKKYSKSKADFTSLINFDRYENELATFYLYRAACKLWIKDTTACNDLEQGLIYCKNEEDIKMIKSLQQKHCIPPKRT